MPRKSKMFEVDYERKTKKIEGYTVIEAAMREAVRKINMARSVEAYVKARPDDIELSQVLALYPLIFGCTSPLLTIEQYLEVPEKVLNDLVNAAMELNPHWFEFPDQEKKTNEQPMTSSENSES